MRTLARPEDVAELLRRLKQVRAESPRRFGKMSAHQMVCHLCDSMRMALGDRAVTVAGASRGRRLVKWVVLFVPVRWRSGIRTCPELDQEAGGTRPSNFAADLAELEALMRVVAARPRSAAWPSHPVFGPMSASAWLRWAYLHTEHHLRQFGA